jgi:hypothetical protein
MQSYNASNFIAGIGGNRKDVIFNTITFVNEFVFKVCFWKSFKGILNL